MKKKYLMHKFSKVFAVMLLSAALALGGCTSASNLEETVSSTSSQTESSVQAGQTTYSAAANAGEVTTIDITDMFSKRDMETEYKEDECVLITLNGTEAQCSSSGVTIEDGTVIIKEAGSYLLRGSYNGSIRVEAPEDAKVQLILDGVTIRQSGTAAIYGKTADKIFLTMAEGSSNQIINEGDFQAIDENNIDGAIYSKCDLTLNGNGTLTVNSEKGHGIVSKDDLKITSGTYVITAGDHGISGKDSIRIADGDLTITSTEDGLHSGNDEDADKGYVYVAGGKITISAGDDAIHGETKVVIADGKINITKSKEGIEAAIVEIAGGEITVVASDDGLNCADGSSTEGFGGRGFGQQGASGGNTAKSSVYLLISGGKILMDAKGDGIDSNGDVYVTGGEIYVSGPENNGNGALDYDSKGEITGGSFIAIGSTGMAMNFNSATQGSALITLSSTHKAGEQIQLKDSSGNLILSFTSTRSFASVVVSSPLMKQGGTYTLTVGSETQTFTLDQLLYGQSNGFGGMGGFGGGRGGFGGFGGQRPDGSDGQMPEGFDGQFPEGFDGQMPNWGDGQMPEGFDGQLPEGFDGQMPNWGDGQMPEGFNGQFPEGFDGQMPNWGDGQKPGAGQGQMPDGSGGRKSGGSKGQRSGDSNDQKQDGSKGTSEKQSSGT